MFYVTPELENPFFDAPENERDNSISQLNVAPFEPRRRSFQGSLLIF
jgi:hypothetical protein